MRSIKIFTLIAVVLGMTIPVKSQEKTGSRLYNSGIEDAAIIYFKKVIASSQDARAKAEANYYIANCLINAGNPDEAITFFNSGIAADPTYQYNNIGLTGLTTLKQDPKAAEGIFKAAIKLEKKEINVYLAIARAYMSQKDYVGANEYIDRAIKIDKTNGIPYLLKGDIALKMNKHMDAASQYEQAMYFDENLIGAYIKYSDIYRMLNTDLAILTLENAKAKLAELSDDFSGIDLLLGRIYFNQGKSAEAVAGYASFIEDGYHAESHLLDYALALYIDKQYDKVLSTVAPVLQKDPNNLNANRINAYAKAKIESGESGLSYIKTFVENSPKDKLISLDYVAFGEKLNENKLYIPAIESFEKAISLDSNRRYLYEIIADAYVQEKEIDSAIKYYDLYVAIAGKEDLVVQFKYGRNIYSMASNFDSTMRDRQIYFMQKADTIFQVIVELAPDNYLGYLWRARVNSFLDMETILGLAKPYYEQVVEISLKEADARKRELSEAYRYLGYYYYVQGEAKATAAAKNNVPDYKAGKDEYLKSSEYFSKVLEIEPENAVAKQVVDVINNLNLEK